MLVLSRKRDEEAIITIPEGTVVPKGGMQIRVTVVDIRYDRVRIGFDGPPEIPIHRLEVQRQIDRP